MAQKEELDFQTTMEALFVEALGPQMTPRLAERLKAEGLDLALIQAAYPRQVFSRCCRIAVEELFPGLSAEEGLRLLGRRMIEGYSRTVIGKAVVGVFKVIGVRRGLDRLTRAFRTGDNYTETRFTSLGDGEAELWFNQVNGQPEFTRGALEACLEWVGAKQGTVDVVRCDGTECLYRIRWS